MAILTVTRPVGSMPATLTEFVNEIFPVYGTPRKLQFDWDESQKMWLCDRYISDRDIYHYFGFRTCGNVAFRENVTNFHHCTYINDLTLYAFDGTMPVLIECRKFPLKTHRNESEIRAASEDMLRTHIKATLKMQRIDVTNEDIAREAKRLTDGCYKSFLDDDYNMGFLQLVAQLKD